MVEETEQVLDLLEGLFVVSVVHGVIISKQFCQSFVVLGENQTESHFKLLDLVFVIWLDHDEKRFNVKQIEVTEPLF